jgi:hypothetical protein
LEDRIRFYVENQRVPEEKVRILAKVDPTGGKYLGWLIKNIPHPERHVELWRVKEELAFYEKVSKSKALLEHLDLPGDINKLSEDQLYESWYYNKDKDLRSKIQEGKKAKSTAKVVYSKGPYKVLQIGGEGIDPETAVEALCGYSKGTSWCTRHQTMARSYLGSGPMFLAFKGNERLFLANGKGDHIKNVANEPLELTEEIMSIMSESGLLQFWEGQKRREDEFRSNLLRSLR